MTQKFQQAKDEQERHDIMMNAMSIYVAGEETSCLAKKSLHQLYGDEVGQTVYCVSSLPLRGTRRRLWEARSCGDNAMDGM